MAHAEKHGFFETTMSEASCLETGLSQLNFSLTLCMSHEVAIRYCFYLRTSPKRFAGFCRNDSLAAENRQLSRSHLTGWSIGGGGWVWGVPVIHSSHRIPSVRPSVRPSIHPSIPLTVYLSVSLPACLPVRLSVCLSLSLSLYLPVCIYIYIHIYTYI